MRWEGECGTLQPGRRSCARQNPSFGQRASEGRIVGGLTASPAYECLLKHTIVLIANDSPHNTENKQCVEYYK